MLVWLPNLVYKPARLTLSKAPGAGSAESIAALDAPPSAKSKAPCAVKSAAKPKPRAKGLASGKSTKPLYRMNKTELIDELTMFGDPPSASQKFTAAQSGA